MSRRKQVARKLGEYALKGLLKTFHYVPIPIAMRIGRGLGALIQWFAPGRHKVAMRNLCIAFGKELSESERKRIARESFRQFGMWLIEIIQFVHYVPKDFFQRISITDEDMRPLHDSLAKGKGVMVLTAHLGNFEIGGRYLVMQGHEMLGLMRDTQDEGTAELLKKIRSKSGLKLLSVRNSLKPVFTMLKKGGIVSMLCDQNASDVYVPLFGRPTGTVVGPARFALRTGSPMVFMFCVRTGMARYRIFCTGSYEIQPTGDDRADMEACMTEVNRHYELAIREYPEQWLWFHNRWKRTPIEDIDC